MAQEIQCVDMNDIQYNTLSMDDIGVFEDEDYDLANPKDFKKYIDDVEKVVRSSREYNKFIMYLRNYMDMNKCAFFQNVNNIDTTKIKIELHHHPFTLFDIANIIYEKRRRCDESLEVEMVAKESMYIHYFLYIGLVPLAQTTHELVHQQLLFIPLNIVLGNYQKFYNLYEPYISEEIKEKLTVYEEMTKAYNENRNLEILKTVPIYLQFPHGQELTYSLPRLKDLLETVGDKLLALEDTRPKGIIIDPFVYDNNPPELIRPFEIIPEPIKNP